MGVSVKNKIFHTPFVPFALKRSGRILHKVQYRNKFKKEWVLIWQK